MDSLMVLGHEVELDFSSDGKQADVYCDRSKVGTVRACSWDSDLFYSSVQPDQGDTLQNHLELLVRAASRQGVLL